MERKCKVPVETSLEAAQKKHVYEFERCQDCTDTLTKLLLSLDLITQFKEQQILGKSTPIERNRELILTLPQTVHNEDKFRLLCSALNVLPHYQKFARSLKTYYAIHQCQEEIPQLLANMDHLVLMMQTNLTEHEIHALSNSADVMKDRKSMDREVYFTVEILLAKYKDYFQLHFMSCLEGDPSNTWLLHKINGMVDGLHMDYPGENINPYSPSTASALHRYYDFLIGRYKRDNCMNSNDWPLADGNISPTKLSFHLALIKTDNDEKVAAKLRLSPNNAFFNSSQPEPEIEISCISELEFFSSLCAGKRFLIQGAIGSGKTSLAFKVCQQWVNGGLPQYKLAILLRLKDPNVSKAKNLTELFSQHMEALGKDIAQDIDNATGEGILFILDGWNELDAQKTPESLLDQIISTRLPKSTILITARPSSAFKLRQQYEFTQVIELLNLTEPQLDKHLIHQFPEDNGKHFSEEVSKHVCFKGLLLMPLFLSLLMHIYRKGNRKISESLTHLYKTMLLLIINRHLKGSFQGLEDLSDDSPVFLLSKLAYTSLCKEKLTHSEICKLCTQSDELSPDFHWFGLLQAEHHPETAQPDTYQFLHPAIQQFLATLYLIQGFDPKQQEDELKNMFGKAQCEMLWVFYAGLTGFTNIDINRTIPKLAMKGRLLTMATRGVYNLAAMALMKNSGTKDCTRTNYSAQDYGCFVHDSVSKEALLVLMAACAEANNPELCQAICNSNLFLSKSCYAEIPDSAATRYLLSSLSQCIIHSGKKWVVQCNALQHDMVDYMLAELPEPEGNTGSISMFQTKASPKQVEAVVSLLKSPLMQQLQSLDLSNSANINASCIQKLLPALHSVVLLDLINCNIDSKSAPCLAEFLRANSTLEYLALTENPLVIEDVVLMVKALSNNDTLLVLAINGPLQKAARVKDAAQQINSIRKEHKARQLGFECFEAMRFSTVWSKVVSVFYSFHKAFT